MSIRAATCKKKTCKVLLTHMLAQILVKFGSKFTEFENKTIKKQIIMQTLVLKKYKILNWEAFKMRHVQQLCSYFETIIFCQILPLKFPLLLQKNWEILQTFVAKLTWQIFSLSSRTLVKNILNLSHLLMVSWTRSCMRSFYKCRQILSQILCRSCRGIWEEVEPFSCFVVSPTPTSSWSDVLFSFIQFTWSKKKILDTVWFFSVLFVSNKNK